MNSEIVGFVTVIGIVMGLGTGMLSLFLNYRKRREMFALYHQERMAAIEKGIELPALPEDFFHEDAKPQRSGHGTFLSGLILVSVGLTLYVALHFTADRTESGGDVALFALIPAGVGAACLIYYYAVGRKLATALEDERKARFMDAARAKNLMA